jgi:hypothetical protein
MSCVRACDGERVPNISVKGIRGLPSFRLNVESQVPPQSGNERSRALVQTRVRGLSSFPKMRRKGGFRSSLELC